jgi:hypothetical protein
MVFGFNHGIHARTLLCRSRHDFHSLDWPAQGAEAPVCPPSRQRTTEVKRGFIIHFGQEHLRGYSSLMIGYINLYEPSSSRFCVVGHLRSIASLNARYPRWPTKARRRHHHRSYTPAITQIIRLVLGIPLFRWSRQPPCRYRRSYL